MGSTDNTTSVINHFLGGDYQVQIIPFAREHLLQFGYAHARNFVGLRSTRPWLLAVDADEILVDGIKDGKIALNLPANMTSIATAERRNLVRGSWKIGDRFNAGELPVGKVEHKKRLYRPAERVHWRGYIHEDLFDAVWGDARTTRSPLAFEHLASYRDQSTARSKRQMYSWMLMRVFKEVDLRDGVGRFWYEEFVPKHLLQIEAEAREFDSRNSSGA